MRKCLFLACLFAGSAWAGFSAAQPRPDYSVVSEDLTDLGHGVYALHPVAPPSMGIGDSAFAVGNDGVILVDTQFPSLPAKSWNRSAARPHCR